MEGSKSTNKKFYENYSTKFKNQNLIYSESEYIQWSRATATRLRGWLPKKTNSRILDVGCGHGNLLFMFRFMGYDNIEGIDISFEQVSIARNQGFEVHHGDALELMNSTREKRYSLITAFDFVEHLTKKEAVIFLEATRACLEDGGNLVLQLPNAAAPRGMHFQASDITHETFFGPSSIKQLLLSTGFSDIEIREVSVVNTGWHLGPIPLNPKRLIQKILWFGVKTAYKLRDYAEGYGQKIYTRNMLVSAKK